MFTNLKYLRKYFHRFDKKQAPWGFSHSWKIFEIRVKKIKRKKKKKNNF